MNPRLRPDALQQSHQCVSLQSDTSGGRQESIARKMDEHRAAAPGDARARVVIDLDNEIVEMIVAPEPVAGLIRPAPERSVVAPIRRVLAPGIVLPDRSDRKHRFRPRRAVGPPPQSPQPERSARRCAVALAFVGQNTSAPERDRDRQQARCQQAFSPLPGSGTHREQTDRRASAMRVNTVPTVEHGDRSPFCRLLPGACLP